VIAIACASLASWWWAYEGEVDRDLLLEKLLAVRAFDCCFGLLDGVVLDEDVTLPRVSSTIALVDSPVAVIPVSKSL
jgi:hypothetical protein